MFVMYKLWIAIPFDCNLLALFGDPFPTIYHFLIFLPSSILHYGAFWFSLELWE